MLTASLAQGRRELARLQSGQLQAESDYRRLEPLAAAGFVPAAALEQAQRERELATALLQQGRVDQRIDAQSAQRSLSEMELAVRGLHDGLRMLERARHRLQQRAPITGRLSSFRLQVGSSVRPGDRLGRIDDPDGGLQLVAEVDEFYLPRLREGQVATSANGTLQLVQTLPQVQAGKARVVLRWPQDAATPELRPGQAVDLRLQLARPRPALLLPDGPGVQTRLYVHQNRRLLRREVQLGQRAAGQVEVLAGLHAGEVVLISQPPSDAERFALP